MQVLVAQSWAALYGMDVVVAEPSNLIGPGRSGGLCGLLARYAPLPAPFRLSSIASSAICSTCAIKSARMSCCSAAGRAAASTQWRQALCGRLAKSLAR
ncbi:hypothetical protein [Paenibacillus sp. R14(2021)]|uniref:hypothetical protein n=1 Tax=Paenibacillus sp. R14(2021) TaxID=2859228 RepID=UPI001C616811|nr:hypothetical protein [Paenibacillus sp. R14(2021)]